MTPEKLKKMRACAPLLPPPGGDVVVELIDEVERLQGQMRELGDSRDELLFEYAKGLENICDALADLIVARAPQAERDLYLPKLRVLQEQLLAAYPRAPE